MTNQEVAKIVQLEVFDTMLTLRTYNLLRGAIAYGISNAGTARRFNRQIYSAIKKSVEVINS